jgi:hypothetical protein
MTPFSAASLRQRFNAVIGLTQSLRRLACRLSASISSAFFIEFPFTQRRCKTVFRLESNSLLFPVSTTRPHITSTLLRTSYFKISLFRRTSQKFPCCTTQHPMSACCCSDTDSTSANSFLSSVVRQFHFISRTALPTFITLFQPHSPTKLFFFHSSRRTSSHLTR